MKKQLNEIYHVKNIIKITIRAEIIENENLKL